MKTLESSPKTLKYNNPAQLVKIVLCSAIIAFSLGTFMFSGVLRSFDLKLDLWQSADFQYLYSAGQMWNEGLDPYNREAFRARFIQVAGDKALQYSSGYAYPPQGSVLFGLLATMSVETARLVFLGINLLLLAGSLWMLAHILSWYRPIGLLEITLLVSLLNTGFARRNIRDGQTGLIICALILGTFILAHHGRKVLAGVSLSALSFKPTFLPLLLGYYLLRRSWRLLIACVISGLLLTVIPIMLSGRSVVDTLAGWFRMLQMWGEPGIENDPSPTRPESALLLNLAPLVFRIFNAQSGLTSGLAWLILLVLCGFSAFMIWRTQALADGKSELLDFGLVSTLSLLLIYHRNYDIFLLFPGLLYLYLHTIRHTNKAIQRNWAIFLALVILLLALPSDLLINISYKVSALEDNYLWRVIAPFQTWAVVATLGALLRLKTRQTNEGKEEVRSQKSEVRIGDL